MKNYRPIIGITMGDPVGIGPEIILTALCEPAVYKACRPFVIGDAQRLEAAKKCTKSSLHIRTTDTPDSGRYECGFIDLLTVSKCDPENTYWGKPTAQTGKAMVGYIIRAIDMAACGSITAIVTCPINKMAMRIAGYAYNGHTELLAERTRTDNFAMMLAGDKLRVILVTIHVPLKDVPSILSMEKIVQTISIAHDALYERFGLEKPHIAVAGLNPHAGERGMFGNEEENIIIPAVNFSRKQGIDVSGPFPPDTIFYHAAKGDYDAVVCMYHDQGLIPFKMIHFTDGVNTTLGLPIIRTSVDHGTAYDIAGTGKADPGSLIAAINMATHQAVKVQRFKGSGFRG
ncbi:MAG: 4-hydroxythreonine-4-phosphate dehydrogenase PdxA [Desulfobacterales bacterium]|nr:4-hydroxythreonine-4-phosphate dehydrogenase PdxA [Desulfobacterales bacterium]